MTDVFDLAAMSVTDWVASAAIVVGALMSLLAGIAVLRFPDTMSRIHAATKPQVLGIMLLMLGVGLRLQSPAVIGVLVLIVVLQFVTAPVSAHLTVRAAYRNSVDDSAAGGSAAGGSVAGGSAAGEPTLGRPADGGGGESADGGAAAQGVGEPALGASGSALDAGERTPTPESGEASSGSAGQ